VFAGRKTPYKGPQVLVDALPKICRAYPNTLALLFGPDYYFGSNITSYSNLLRQQAKSLDVEKNLVLQNYVSEEKLITYINAADVFVCPSIWQEPFGKVVIEANACGKPVVASRVGGLPELIRHNENGLLVPSNDADALADAVMTLFADKQKANSMGATGRKMVEKNFSYKVVSAKCQGFYRSMLN
jgi:spore coat protein SA